MRPANTFAIRPRPAENRQPPITFPASSYLARQPADAIGHTFRPERSLGARYRIAVSQPNDSPLLVFALSCVSNRAGTCQTRPVTESMNVSRIYITLERFFRNSSVHASRADPDPIRVSFCVVLPMRQHLRCAATA